MIRSLKRQLKRLVRRSDDAVPPGLNAQRLIPATHPQSIRTAFIAALKPSTQVLEIGPYFNPAITGPNVRYFDVFDRASLVERARLDPQIKCGPQAIPEIHYHSPTGDLSIVDETFDAVFSSHCIEHQPDLVRHLKDVCGILHPGGRYHVICPDKRYCFDHFRPLSSIGAVLEAHAAKRVFHSRGDFVDHCALSTHNEAVRHWSGDHIDSPQPHSLVERIVRAAQIYDENPGTYLDTHAWTFQPATFLHITETLFELGLTGLRPVSVWDTPVDQHEFTAILERPA